MKLFDTYFVNKRFKTILFVTFYILGIVSFLTSAVLPYAFAIFILLCVLLKKNFISGKFAVISLLIFFIGFLNVLFRLKTSDEVANLAPSNGVTLCGTVVSLPTSSSKEYTKFYFKVDKYKKFSQPETVGNGKVIVTLFKTEKSFKDIEIGDRLSLSGQLSKPRRASNPSEFCYATYLKHQNVFSRLFANDSDCRLLGQSKNTPYAFLASLNKIRTNIINKHSENIKSPELELLGGIVFGDDAVNPTPEMKDSFQKSGLTHIIAASGMNVTMIFGMWFFLSQLLRLNYKFSILAGMGFVICYTCMTGFGPPVLRASLMLLLILLGKLIDRKSDSVSLIFIVAFLMLAVSPTMITNIGFQLSFLVTLGLMIFCPLVLDKIKSKFWSVAASFVFVPVIAQLFASPVQMFYFNSFSPYSVFANIFVVPVLSVVSFVGFVSCFLAEIKIFSFEVIKAFDFVLNPFLSVIVGVADFFSSLPFSIVKVASPAPIEIILYFLILLLAAAFFAFKKNKKLIVSLLAITVLSLLICYFAKKDNSPYVIFFSVENADSALIKTKSGKYVLIDTGKTGYKNFITPAERVLVKYFEDENINTLDMLVLSHFDSDHAGGTLPLLENVKIKKIFLKDKNSENNLAKKIINKSKSLNIETVVPLDKEVILDEGDCKISCFYINSKDDNASSIVNVLETPSGSVIFAADTTIKSLEKMLDVLPKNVFAIKAPHHGADKTLNDKILSEISPKYAIISTGMNIYGHPSKNTMNLLKKHNAKILRTDKNNAVKLVFHNNEILVYAYNSKKKKFERAEND